VVAARERGSWPEGRWLAVDLATALERRDTKAAGELETIAALVSSDSLLPGDDGNAPLLTLLAESVKHAVGVSKDLRNGVRESIELLATEVLRRRRDREMASDQPGLAADLTRQSLRYLYRILFLLYAEAHPELGVLPVGTTEYAEGDGLDRLRELVLTELTSAAAGSGTHLYQSLGVLFRLVNDGYPPETLGPDGVIATPPDDEGELRFEALRADLFSRNATALIDDVGLGKPVPATGAGAVAAVAAAAWPGPRVRLDLDATAVELTEITLWLDAMHPGLRAPWFGLHLRRGNSLIGARRETYSPAQLAKRAWLTTVPTARPLGEPAAATDVHHFLLPAVGWAAVADTAEAKEGRPTATAALKVWRRSVTATLSKAEQTRLQALGQRVEALWALALRRLEVAESEIRRRIDVWGADDLAAGSGAVQREQIEKSLTDANSA
jgi:hypothetical protein